MAIIGHKKFDLFKCEKILIGNPSDNLDESKMDEFRKEFIVEKSVKVIKPKPSTTSISTEGDDNYRSLTAKTDPSSIEFGLYGVPLDYAPNFFGGSYDSDKKEFHMPDTTPDIYRSIILYTGETLTDGTRMKIVFPYAQMSAGFTGELTKDNIMSITVVAEANKPVGMTATSKFILGEYTPTTTP